MKNLFIIESIQECKIFLRDYFPLGDDFVIISENASVQTILLGKEISCKTRSDYLTHDELNAITSISIRYMDNWFYYKNFSLYNTIHLCSLYAMDFGFIERIILYIEKLIKAVQKERPQKIIVSESYKSLTENVIRLHTNGDIECEEYISEPLQKTISRLRNNPYYQYLKRANLHTMIKEIRDYVFPLPREFRMKGNSGINIANESIIITAVHQNEVNVSANPAIELANRGFNLTYFVIDCDGGRVLKKMKAAGFRYIRPGDLFNQKYKKLYKDIRKRFKNIWLEISNDPGFWDSLLYKEIPVLRYVNREKLKWLIAKVSPFWAVIYEMLLDLFKKITVKAVIAVNDPITLGRTAAFAAERLSVPSIDIQHGSFMSIPARAVADKWCVWSDADKQLLVTMGIPHNKLEVTGNPAFDTLITPKFDADSIKLKFGLSSRYKTIVTWAPTAAWLFYYSEENYNEKIFAVLQDVARRHRDIMFIFKPHPSERINRFTRIQDKSLSNILIANPQQSAYEIMYISDIVMSWNSSVIIEAVILDKPIIGLNFFEQAETLRCVSEGVAIEVSQMKELEEAINAIILNKNNMADSMKNARRGYIEKFLYKADGRSSSRIADLLEDLVTDSL